MASQGLWRGSSAIHGLGLCCWEEQVEAGLRWPLLLLSRGLCIPGPLSLSSPTHHLTATLPQDNSGIDRGRLSFTSTEFRRDSAAGALQQAPSSPKSGGKRLLARAGKLLLRSQGSGTRTALKQPDCAPGDRSSRVFPLIPRKSICGAIAGTSELGGLEGEAEFGKKEKSGGSSNFVGRDSVHFSPPQFRPSFPFALLTHTIEE